MYKNFHHTLNILLIAILTCEMQMFENDTNCADITTKSYNVKVSDILNQLLTLSQNLLKISPLTYIQDHRCVCHLLIAGRVHYLSPRFLGQATSRSATLYQKVVVTGVGDI